MRLTKHPDNPILSPNPQNSWESLSVTNPGAVLDEKSGKVLMLYRAGDTDAGYSRAIGLAESSDGVHFERVSHLPVLSACADGWDAGSVEDPRIMRIGDWYVVTYVGFPRAQGQVYLPPEQRALTVADYPDCFPGAIKWNIVSTGIGLTKDFRTWYRAGRVTDSMVPDRDVVFFPEKINGRWWRLSRPSKKNHPHYGIVERPSIWIGHSEDLLSWREADTSVLLQPQFDWEGQKIGANTPPLKTEDGWLVLYHGVSQADHHYRIGAFLCALDDPAQVTHRTEKFIMEPTEQWELEGLYNGVVFPDGIVDLNGTLHIYYGGGDKHVGLATCAKDKLLEFVKRFPV